LIAIPVEMEPHGFAVAGGQHEGGTGRDGDRINAVLAAAGYNFSLLLRWFEELLCAVSLILWHALLAVPLHLIRVPQNFLRGRLKTAEQVNFILLSTAPGMISRLSATCGQHWVPAAGST
jgi:hypothetical protein